MSFGKFFKKVFKTVHPVESKVFGLDKKKGGGPDAPAPTYTQADLANEENNYNQLAGQAQTGAVDRAKAAGTYADTRAMQDAINAEAGAATRQMQYQSTLKQNAIRKYLGMPTIAVGTAPSEPGKVQPVGYQGGGTTGTIGSTS